MYNIIDVMYIYVQYIFDILYFFQNFLKPKLELKQTLPFFFIFAAMGKFVAKIIINLQACEDISKC